MELADGSTYTANTDHRDLVAWDIARGPRKWPKFDEAPFLALTVLAWSALRRSGEIDGLTLDRFLTDAVSVESLEEGGTPTPTP